MYNQYSIKPKANSLYESKIQKLSSMKKSLSLLSCCLIFIVDHISSLSFYIIYLGYRGLNKISKTKVRKFPVCSSLKGHYFLPWVSLCAEIDKILFEQRRSEKLRFISSQFSKVWKKVPLYAFCLLLQYYSKSIIKPISKRYCTSLFHASCYILVLLFNIICRKQSIIHKLLCFLI